MKEGKENEREEPLNFKTMELRRWRESEGLDEVGKLSRTRSPVHFCALNFTYVPGEECRYIMSILFVIKHTTAGDFFREWEKGGGFL